MNLFALHLKRRELYIYSVVPQKTSTACHILRFVRKKIHGSSSDFSACKHVYKSHLPFCMFIYVSSTRSGSLFPTTVAKLKDRTPLPTAKTDQVITFPSILLLTLKKNNRKFRRFVSTYRMIKQLES